MNQVRGRVGPIPALHNIPDRPHPSFELYTQSLQPADPALVRILEGHTDKVRGCAFSPDGALALSASFDQTLRLWEVATGALRATWYGETSNPCCAFGPQGDRALVGDAVGGVHLFRLDGIEPLATPVATPAVPPAMPPAMPAMPPAAPAVSTTPPVPATNVQPAATSAPPPEPAPKPRRKRFWFF